MPRYDLQELLKTEEVKVWNMFLRAHAVLMRQMEAELQGEHGISLRWLDALVQLSLADGKRMTHTRLGQRILVGITGSISGGGLTRMVDRMAKAGLVTRRASRTDRRTSYIVLTDKGQETLDRVSETQAGQVVELFTSHLEKEEIPVIRAFLARVLGESTGEENQRPETSKS